MSPQAQANRAEKVQRIVKLLQRDHVTADIAALWDDATRRAVERRAGCRHASAGSMTWDAVLSALAGPALSPEARRVERHLLVFGPPS